ncbi:uncharacterized protein [Argopecten irradians]|uniref:uncharacterized protein n=1 Tax=Argopecten irradians TaxID=31199 RepID=UPI00371B3D40
MTGYSCWTILYMLVIVAAHDHLTTLVDTTKDGGYDIIIPENCTVKFNETDIKSYLELKSNADTKLVYVHFHFTGHNGRLKFEDQGELFEPLNWVYVSDHQGKMLLNLLQQFEALSLQTMSIGVEHETIKITEYPAGCLTNQPMEFVGPYFRDTLLNNFESSVEVKTNMSSDKPMDEQTDDHTGICHMTIGKEGNIAKFFYTCCHKNTVGVAVCEELEVNSYMEVVKVFIFITNILMIVFSPYLVPQYYYSDSTGCVSYEQDPKTERESVTILKTNVQKSTRVRDRGKHIKESVVDDYMPKFNMTVKELKNDKPCECDIGTITFSVKTRDLISESDVPVGIFSTLYNNFARCEIKHHKSMRECCNADMLRMFGCSVNWYDCLTRLMTSIVLITFAIPWMLRVVFYVTYERAHFEGQASASYSRQLNPPYQANLSLYLSPLHVLFIVCYFFIVVEGMCLGILHRNVTRSLRIVFRECFKDMRRSSQLTSLGKLWEFMLLPCTKCYIFGLVLFPVVWALVIPIALVIAAFKYLPIVNLSLRLFGKLLYNICPTGIAKAAACYTPDPEEKREIKCFVKLRHVLLTLFCLLALYSFLLLLVEFIQFIVVMVIYTLMGMILNSSVIMQYFPLAFMLGVYGNQTFKGVYKKYMFFNKIVHKHVMEIFKRTSSEAERELMNSRANTAFEVHHEAIGTSSKDYIYVKNSDFKWLSKRTVLFVDKHGTRYIRKDFFFDCCDMDHFAAPGKLVSNLRTAVLKFVAILGFLAFVGLVVLAFSKNFELSSTNQTIIALAGGLIPFVLSNFLFRRVQLPEVEEDDIRFTRNLTNIISNYDEKFDVIDFKCLNVRDDNGEPYTSTTALTTPIVSNGVTISNGLAPTRAGTHGHVINLNVSSPGLDTINQYADDSEHISDEETSPETTSPGPTSTDPPSTEPSTEQTEVLNVSGEIINEQTTESSLPIDQHTPDDDSSSHSSSSSSSSPNSRVIKVTRDLSNYDIVVDTNRPVTAAEYLVSLI